MKLIFSRSPYIIQINESGQTGAKVKLYIWNKTYPEPTIPTYTLSKDIPSLTQTELNFNISNYVKEFINHISFTGTGGFSEAANAEWCNVKVERYKVISGVETLIDTETYVATDGYTIYSDGLNGSINADIIALTSARKIYYDRNNTYMPYINIFLDVTGVTGALRIEYENLNGEFLDFYDWDSTGINNYCVPIALGGVNYDNGNLIKIYDYTNSEYPYLIDTFTAIPICEPKYTPVLCSYINRRGGWEFITFFKSQTNSINVKGSTYKMMPSNINYGIQEAQTKSFNINGQQTIKLNTGWVEDDFSVLITELLLSETVLLNDKPVEIKTQSSDLKTSLKDKMINYEIEFEYAYNLINDVV